MNISCPMGLDMSGLLDIFSSPIVGKKACEAKNMQGM